jgi:hypothetical protein
MIVEITPCAAVSFSDLRSAKIKDLLFSMKGEGLFFCCICCYKK